MSAIVVDGVEFQEPPKGSHRLTVSALAEGVHCLYSWHMDWGPAQWRSQAHVFKYSERMHKDNPRCYPKPPQPIALTKEWASERIQEGLDKIGKGLVVAAFPSYAPYNKNACLLPKFGFRLLGGRCYPNANYPISNYRTLPKGSIYSEDQYPHWIHIWVKDLKGIEKCGEGTWAKTPEGQSGVVGFPYCCGLKMRYKPGELRGADPYGSRQIFERFLALCQIPADQRFPKGWQRFALYKDYKWGINFNSEKVRGVQKCPHIFDLDRIEAWEMAQPLPKLV